jgi:hypothetical protein
LEDVALIEAKAPFPEASLLESDADGFNAVAHGGAAVDPVRARFDGDESSDASEVGTPDATADVTGEKNDLMFFDISLSASYSFNY